MRKLSRIERATQKVDEVTNLVDSVTSLGKKTRSCLKVWAPVLLVAIDHDRLVKAMHALIALAQR